MKISQTLTHIEVNHYGLHNHRRPHPIRADLSARIYFEQLVKTAPEVRPKALQIGTETRVGLAEINPKYGNLSHVAYQ